MGLKASGSRSVLYLRAVRCNNSKKYICNMKEEIENLINEFYKIISGKKNQERNWELFKALFSPEAKLLPLRHTDNINNIMSYSIDEYINRLESFLAENDFYEYGENYKIKVFNNLAYAYTEYKAKRNEHDKIFIKKGINLIHFVNNGQRWYISSMQWEDSFN